VKEIRREKQLIVCVGVVRRFPSYVHSLRRNPVNESQIHLIPLTKIRWPDNERKHFDPDSLKTLADSIRQHGIKQPIGIVAEQDGGYRGLWGQRRLKAAALAGLAEIPAIIHPAPKDEIEEAKIRLTENIARENLLPMELARGLERLLYGGVTAAAVAAGVGMSAAGVTRSVSLLTLSPEIQLEIENGKISAAAGYELTLVTDPALREELARRTAEGKITRDGLAARRKQSSTVTETSSTPAATTRATAKLGNGKSVTVYAPDLTLDLLIDTLEEASKRAKKARDSGVQLPTFLRILRDTARS
jgi:ParB family chromosome partitioning protein